MSGGEEVPVRPRRPVFAGEGVDKRKQCSVVGSGDTVGYKTPESELASV